MLVHEIPSDVRRDLRLLLRYAMRTGETDSCCKSISERCVRCVARDIAHLFQLVGDDDLEDLSKDPRDQPSSPSKFMATQLVLPGFDDDHQAG